MKLTQAGKQALRCAALAAVTVLVTASYLSLTERQRLRRLQRLQNEKRVEWEYLEGTEGADLQRAETPHGWLVEGVDGYLVYVPDHKKKWLDEEE